MIKLENFKVKIEKFKDVAMLMKKARLSRGWKQYEMGEYLTAQLKDRRVTGVSVCKYENGEVNPPGTVVVEAMKLLNMDI